MEKQRGTKIIAIIALFVAIVGVTLGFAAFTNNLTITSTAEVKPLNSLKVLFSTSNSSQVAVNNNIGISYLPSSGEPSAFTATTPVINNETETAPTLSNLKATFAKPGESVTYSLYIHNASTYAAQLTAIAFGTKQCQAKSGTDSTLVAAACDEIDVSVTVGSSTSAVTKTQSTSQSAAVSGHTLAADAYEPVTVTLSYADLSEGDGNTVLNGDFDVTFGDVTLTYSSAVNE